MDDIEAKQLFPEHYLPISSVIFSLSALIGIIVNIVVIVVVKRAWSFNKKPVYVLIISGSVCGLLICLTVSPYEALMRLESFRNLIAGTPIGFLFCKDAFSGYVAAILNPISSWTNVSIAYNRYAMCRFNLDTYRRKFSRSRTFRWVRFTWMVPIIYGTIFIALTYSKTRYSQSEQKNGTFLEGGPHMGNLNSTLLHVPLSVTENLSVTMSNLAAQFNSEINPSQFWTYNQTSPHPLSSTPSTPQQDFGDQKFEFSTDAGILDYSKHAEHLLKSQTLSDQQNTTDSRIISGNLTSISGNMNSISGNQSSISGNLSSISGNVSSISGNMSSISGNLSSISGNVSSISGNMSSISGNLSMAILESRDEPRETCTFGKLAGLEGTAAIIIVMAFTFISNIIPNLFALYSMFYVLRRVDAVDNSTLINWTKGTVMFLGIRALLSLPFEIMILLRLRVFGISIPYFPYFLMRDLKLLLVTADPFIFGLRLPDFKAFLQNNGQ